MRKILLLTTVLALAGTPSMAQQFGNPAGPGPVPPSTGNQPAPPAGAMQSGQPGHQRGGQPHAGQGGTLGQSETTGAAPAAGAQALSTADFVRKVAISDLFEIQSSQLAREKADQEGRDFANKMIQAHTKTSTELKTMVQSGKIQAEVPTGLDQEHAQKLQRLRGLSGDAFEDAYAEMQTQAHKDAVALFTAYAQNGDNAELKQWAGKTLPELKQHLDMADDLD
ncbi:DUF4142 domain-containing protein [Rhodoplanes sp. TEM]|uniref:DUF4142 domain-containing protein n=1 Tax=Rhodoplanes tepidamans TaxID=200616 RepID=A0ABT5JJ03_RHOTP|nr:MULTISPECIES: DUF4142 domain-containing protein [Rhodoplanes]MDC7789554.1 DUF4142 domain-containing protein [Rhodoplanes tepidamans]MDC7986729.1 DUF4142 domain-containing protein [Rhodoplanes sp. TEM]MDQ0359157.1 putative membrane protein [Rhodoplanes tepidamans]